MKVTTFKSLTKAQQRELCDACAARPDEWFHPADYGELARFHLGELGLLEFLNNHYRATDAGRELYERYLAAAQAAEAK